MAKINLKNIANEFKTFALKGNVIDLAVGIIIGSTFNRIVSSLVNDIMMPPIGFILGRVDFTNFFISLNGKNYPNLNAARAAGAPTLNYGLFINAVISFTITAFAVFLLVRLINRLKRKEEEKPTEPEVKNCPYCFTNISNRAVKCPACTADLGKEK